MQEKLLDAVREAVSEIASTMLMMEITATSSGSGPGSQSTDLSAIVGYSGAIDGSVHLGAPMASALILAAGLMGEEQAEMSDDAKDAFAELCNMVAGGVQTRVSPEVGRINLTPPVVITGTDHHVKGQSKKISFHQTFEVDAAAFFVEFIIKS